MPRLDPLAAFRAADAPYQQALEDLRALEYARDQALLDARRAGLSEADLIASTGMPRSEVRRMLARAVGPAHD